MNLTPRVVLEGAAADLAVFVPVIALYLLIGGTTAVAAVGGALVAPFVGGIVAGRQPTTAPLTHGAAAAAAASIAYVVVRIVDAVVRHKPVHPASVAFLVILAVTVGTGGAWFGFRLRHQDAAE